MVDAPKSCLHYSLSQIRKLVPRLQIFNAKPIEKWSQRKGIPEGRPEDPPPVEVKERGKRKNPGGAAGGGGGGGGSHETHHKAAGTKKARAAMDPPDDVIISGVDEESVGKKEKKRAGSKSQAFDDRESSFMDLVLAESSSHEAAPVGRPATRAPWDEKLLGGLVLDHTKKKGKGKKKKSAGAHPAAPPGVSHPPEVGVGGPSTWD